MFWIFQLGSGGWSITNGYGFATSEDAETWLHGNKRRSRYVYGIFHDKEYYLKQSMQAVYFYEWVEQDRKPVAIYHEDHVYRG